MTIPHEKGIIKSQYLPMGDYNPLYTTILR